MAYTSFTIRKHPKEKDAWKVDCTTESHDSMGKWEGGGTYGTVYQVGIQYVLMNFGGTKPVAVCSSIHNLAEGLRKKYGVEVTIL